MRVHGLGFPDALPTQRSQNPFGDPGDDGAEQARHDPADDYQRQGAENVGKIIEDFVRHPAEGIGQLSRPVLRVHHWNSRLVFRERAGPPQTQLRLTCASGG